MRGFFVVIPTQTIGFYNGYNAFPLVFPKSCHTYPNDRLLQQIEVENMCNKLLSYLPKR